MRIYGNIKYKSRNLFFQVRNVSFKRVLDQFLNRSRVQVLFADEDTLYEYAKIFFQLRRQGTPIPTNDIWIASLTTQHNLVLYTRDTHFDHLPQIRRL